MRSKLRQLAGALLTRPAEAEQLRQRLQSSHETAAYWKSRFERRSRAVDKFRTIIEALKAEVNDLRLHSDIRKRGELSRLVLEQILPERAEARPVTAAAAAAAPAREARLMQMSSDYRAAVADDGTREQRLQRVDMASIAWWLPKDEGRPGRLEKLREMGLPFRAILQTRELALGGAMLDLGANIGRTSVPRVLLGDVQVVYAAEPEPTNYECLVRNVVEHGLRGYVLPDRAAIGAARGEVQLRRSRHIGGHRVLAAAVDRGDVETVSVPLWPVDEWMARMGVSPDEVSFVKVDTQGSEVNVLRGAPGLLTRRHVAWQMEVDPGLLKHAGATVPELLQLLAAHFTHFIDVGAATAGPRTRPTSELAEAVAYVGSEEHKTDLLLYNGAALRIVHEQIDEA
jgi:FkbM family methyltransferase